MNIQRLIMIDRRVGTANDVMIAKRNLQITARRHNFVPPATEDLTRTIRVLVANVAGRPARSNAAIFGGQPFNPFTLDYIDLRIEIGKEAWRIFVQFIGIGVEAPFIRLNMLAAKVIQVIFPMRPRNLNKIDSPKTGHNLDRIAGENLPGFLQMATVQAT